MEIKDKFAKSRPTISRNLGKLKISVRQLLQDVKVGKPSHVAYSLATPDQPCSASLRFRVTKCLPPASASAQTAAGPPPPPPSSPPQRHRQHQQRAVSFAPGTTVQEIPMPPVDAMTSTALHRQSLPSSLKQPVDLGASRRLSDPPPRQQHLETFVLVRQIQRRLVPKDSTGGGGSNSPGLQRRRPLRRQATSPARVGSMSRQAQQQQQQQQRLRQAAVQGSSRGQTIPNPSPKKQLSPNRLAAAVPSRPKASPEQQQQQRRLSVSPRERKRNASTLAASGGGDAGQGTSGGALSARGQSEAWGDEGFPNLSPKRTERADEAPGRSSRRRSPNSRPESLIAGRQPLVDDAAAAQVQQPPVRPKTLSSQLFGSIDSEQSIPRTAPLATPEHDTSLVDLATMDSSNNNQSRAAAGAVGAGGASGAGVHFMEQQQSLDGFTNDVFNEAVADTAAASCSSRDAQRTNRRSDLRRSSCVVMQEEDSTDMDNMIPGSATDAQSVPSAMANNNCGGRRKESETRPQVFCFNLDSPDRMEEDECDNATRPQQSESSAPIAINYLSAPALDSDGLTPSPMSISEVISSEDRPTAMTDGPGQGTRSRRRLGTRCNDDEDEAEMSSAANSVFNSPTHGFDSGGGATSASAAGQFCVEITPPPDSAHVTHELPDVSVTTAAGVAAISRRRSGNVDMDFHDPSVEQRSPGSNSLRGRRDESPDVAGSSYHTREGYPMCPVEGAAASDPGINGPAPVPIVITTAASPLESDTPTQSSSTALQATITQLPSIPQRSTYRVALPPNEVLPPRKSSYVTLSTVFSYN